MVEISSGFRAVHQPIIDFLGSTITKIFVFRIGAHIYKRQYGYGISGLQEESIRQDKITAQNVSFVKGLRWRSRCH